MSVLSESLSHILLCHSLPMVLKDSQPCYHLLPLASGPELGLAGVGMGQAHISCSSLGLLVKYHLGTSQSTV